MRGQGEQVIGGLTVLQHRSKIVGEQLGPHLDALVATGFLASFDLDKAKTREGFVVTTTRPMTDCQQFKLGGTMRNSPTRC